MSTIILYSSMRASSAAADLARGTPSPPTVKSCYLMHSSV